MIMVPVVWSLLFIWVIVDGLVWGTWLLRTVWWRLQAVWCPVGLRFTVRGCVGWYAVCVRNYRDLLCEGLVGFEWVVQVNRENVGSWDVVFPFYLNWLIFFSDYSGSWKTGPVPFGSLTSIHVHSCLIK